VKDQAPVIVLIIVAIGLGLSLLVVNNKALQQKQALYDALTVQSNTVTAVKASLADQEAVNKSLTTNLAGSRADFSNKLALSQASLLDARENLEKAKSEARAKADSDAAGIAKRDKQISDLENRNQDLDKQTLDLRGNIASLQNQIVAAQNKLSRSDGDRELLSVELKELQADKSALEAKFNDLAALQAQVRKIRNELSQARIANWTRQGVYDNAKIKGGERLISPPANPPPPQDNGLQVELHSAGGSNNVTPVPGQTPPK
jgi:chromosome segregation ATPase